MEIRKDKKPLDKLFRRRDRYDLQPDFQREEVWADDKKKQLLDTILKEWDIPKIYLRVIDEENFEVIDGQQRLNTIFAFYSNDITLSKDFSPKYGGLAYGDLPDKIKDIFDDYELDLVLISNASEDEIRELFQRLQLGVPLNSAEKLHAMSGAMRAFVEKLAKHKFLDKKTFLSKKRYAYEAVCAQIALLGIDGIKNAKYEDLKAFYERHKNFDVNSVKAKRVLKIFNFIDKIFPNKTSSFRNRSSVVSFYLLIAYLLDKGIKIEKKKNILRDFYINFQNDLRKEIEKGAKAEDTELLIYQSAVNQAADSKDSIDKRHRILLRRLSQFDSSLKHVLEASDKEVVELKNKDNLRQLSDKIVELTSDVNKSYSAQKLDEGAMFKLTDSFIKSVTKFNTPIGSKNEFKDFIDALYKVFYEGSGALKRIPDSFINDNSVFFDIKHLRTDCYHDYEHGDKKEIKRKKKTITGIYRKYTGANTLEGISNDNFAGFQIKILKNIKKELLDIKSSLC